MALWYYFLLTVAAESPLIMSWLHAEWKRAFLICLLLNLLTWPLLVTLAGCLQWNVPVLELGSNDSGGLRVPVVFQAGLADQHGHVCTGKRPQLRPRTIDINDDGKAL